MKYLFMEFEKAREGITYYIPLVVKIKDEMDNKTFAKYYASTFYGDYQYIEEDESFFFEEYGSYIRVNKVKEITKEDFDILNRYIDNVSKRGV